MLLLKNKMFLVYVVVGKVGMKDIFH